MGEGRGSADTRMRWAVRAAVVTFDRFVIEIVLTLANKSVRVHLNVDSTILT